MRVTEPGKGRTASWQRRPVVSTHVGVGPPQTLGEKFNHGMEHLTWVGSEVKTLSVNQNINQLETDNMEKESQDKMMMMKMMNTWVWLDGGGEVRWDEQVGRGSMRHFPCSAEES
uniref:Uncharacterized protein n=1 Tax=Knipowitschia caucasica TaxID=637954 RepID=A0AAV2MB25_KNICA